MFDNIYHRRKVLITGHTGFKGSWLALWLSRMGAEVVGYSLPPPTEPNHFSLLNLDLVSVIGDVRDAERLQQVFAAHRPEIVFHLAAQPIVRLSYADPVETLSSNVMGSVHLLEAARQGDSVRAVINVTSDKCYENREWIWGYRESDPLGGYDPYSASKGCAELVTSCWRNSFFNPRDHGKTHHTLLASVRAGNVIGGGDWAPDRLVPDVMRAAGRHEKVAIRNPRATRPWQHVLEPLSGYLLLGQKMLEGRKEFAEAWNFGPAEEGNATVGDIVAQIREVWPEICCESPEGGDQPHEAGMLRLECSKARTRLGWLPVWDSRRTVEKTVLWYRAFYEANRLRSGDDLQDYVAAARQKRLAWAAE